VSFTPASSIATGGGVISGSVSVLNFPATQPVSGSVSVANFPATQPISGSVAVSNFPATQPVSGSVAVTGTVLVDGSAHPQPVTGPLTNAELRAADVIVDQGAGGTAWAVVQATVPWSVSLDAAPASVAVTGPLTDGQLRASRVPVDGSGVTQPVSVASLPLPAGAATEAKQARELAALNDIGLAAILEMEKVPA
jgi:hypothetical protein